MSDLFDVITVLGLLVAAVSLPLAGIGWIIRACDDAAAQRRAHSYAARSGRAR